MQCAFVGQHWNKLNCRLYSGLFESFLYRCKIKIATLNRKWIRSVCVRSIFRVVLSSAVIRTEAAEHWKTFINSESEINVWGFFGLVFVCLCVLLFFKNRFFRLSGVPAWGNTDRTPNVFFTLFMLPQGDSDQRPSNCGINAKNWTTIPKGSIGLESVGSGVRVYRARG